jgi:hypothetical protein
VNFATAATTGEHDRAGDDDRGPTCAWRSTALDPRERYRSAPPLTKAMVVCLI